MSSEAVYPDLLTTVERLRRMPFVQKVVPGGTSSAPHSHRPGELKYVKQEGKAALLRAYSARGMQNLHVYGDLVKLQEALVRPAPKANSGAHLPAESNIEKRSRQQPVYPAQPTPVRPAEPVADTGIKGNLVTVTPDLALNWLERNTRNRPLRDSVVAKYANDMRSGRWKEGGCIVKFAADGAIINGQHFLWAVVQANTAVRAYVLTGLDPSVVEVEDDHSRRQLVDVIRITHPGSTVGTKHTGIATMLRHSMAWAKNEAGDKAVTRQQEMSFLDEHMEAIEFTVRAFSASSEQRRGVVMAATMTPVARAWYTEDRDRLRKFAHVLTSGLVDDTKEQAAVLLRNKLLAAVGARGGTLQMRQETYKLAERALRAFLDGERLQSLRPMNEELFWLPGERRGRPKKTEA
jgi:hypothetical protein